MKSFLTEIEQKELSKIVENILAWGYNKLADTQKQRRKELLIKKYGEY